MLNEVLNMTEDRVEALETRLADAEVLLDRVLAEYSSGLTKKTYALIAAFLAEGD